MPIVRGGQMAPEVAQGHQNRLQMAASKRQSREAEAGATQRTVIQEAAATNRAQIAAATQQSIAAENRKLQEAMVQKQHDLNMEATRLEQEFQKGLLDEQRQDNTDLMEQYWDWQRARAVFAQMDKSYVRKMAEMAMKNSQAKGLASQRYDDAMKAGEEKNKVMGEIATKAAESIPSDVIASGTLQRLHSLSINMPSGYDTVNTVDEFRSSLTSAINKAIGADKFASNDLTPSGIRNLKDRIKNDEITMSDVGALALGLDAMANSMENGEAASIGDKLKSKIAWTKAQNLVVQARLSLEQLRGDVDVGKTVSNGIDILELPAIVKPLQVFEKEAGVMGPEGMAVGALEYQDTLNPFQTAQQMGITGSTPNFERMLRMGQTRIGRTGLFPEMESPAEEMWPGSGVPRFNPFTEKMPSGYTRIGE